jgi:hypothetical protein
MRRENLTAVGSLALAFLATQHHNLHMLIVALGMGSAGMGLMNDFPLLRRLMLAMSLVMAGVTVYGLWRRQRPVRMRVLGGFSAGFTLVMVAWSVYQFGL